VANKQTTQRVTIWVIAIVMTVGTLGAYFLIILQNNDTTKQSQASQQQPEQKLPVDPTAYKVEDKVNELQKTDLTVGNGDELKVGDKIRVHYKGTLATTGQKFDSSYDRGEPADLTLDENSLIKGWVEGLPGMKVGGKRRLVIPASLGYGAQASGGIPANSDLVFEVELLAINPKQ
jgi:FKBP-type peptidyl-prolyl cis-trans isomerase FkpA